MLTLHHTSFQWAVDKLERFSISSYFSTNSSRVEHVVLVHWSSEIEAATAYRLSPIVVLLHLSTEEGIDRPPPEEDKSVDCYDEICVSLTRLLVDEMCRILDV